MTGSVGTLPVKDGNQSIIPGGGRFFDVSGALTGPWGAMYVPMDLGGNAIDLTLPTAIVGNAASGSSDTGAPIKIGGLYTTSPLTLTTGQRGDLQVDTNGVLKVHMFGDNGAGVASTIRAATPAAAGNSLISALSVLSNTMVYNGATADYLKKANTASRLLSSAATTNATSAKASAGDVYRIFGQNTVASVRYLKFYNKASAPTVGTDTPVLTIPIAASAPFQFDIGGAAGFYFSTGIAFAITGASADNDTTAIGAGDIIGLNITYQ